MGLITDKLTVSVQKTVYTCAVWVHVGLALLAQSGNTVSVVRRCPVALA